MKIKRDDLLRALELVQFGVASQETVELSRCFIFQRGQVLAYDDEVLCRIKSGLPKDVSGAADAQRMLNMLRKLPDIELTLKLRDGEFVLLGKRDKTVFRLQKLEGKELLFEQVDKPGEWRPLPESFGEAVGMAQDCALDKDQTFSRTCVHITPKHLEAYDNFQMCRYRLKTGFLSESVSLRKANVKHIASLGMNEHSETEGWVHFRNPAGLTYSCRRWLDDYPDLRPYFKAEGEPVKLPKGLEDLVSRAEEFSQEMADANKVLVHVEPGKVTVIGQGTTGRHEAWKAVKDYQGGEYSFYISPNLLTNIVKKYDTAELTKEALLVRGDNWSYMVALTNPDDVEEDLAESNGEVPQEDEPEETED